MEIPRIEGKSIAKLFARRSLLFVVQLQPLQWDWSHVKRAGLLVKQLGLNPKGGQPGRGSGFI